MRLLIVLKTGIHRTKIATIFPFSCVSPHPFSAPTAKEVAYSLAGRGRAAAAAALPQVLERELRHVQGGGGAAVQEGRGGG